LELEQESFTAPIEVVANPLEPTFGTMVAPALGADVSKYCLIVGPPSWRKARDDGLRVWIALRRVMPTEAGELIIVGPDLTEHERLVVGHLRESITILQDVDDKHLRQLYADATCLILMSKYEGFGWPAAEANSQGTPVIARDTPILRDTAGVAGIYVDPTAPLDGQLRAIRRQLYDAQRRAMHNARRFTMSRYVDALSAVAERYRITRRH
jgi:glycosyltransferase involved in cell wall biosynthesis